MDAIGVASVGPFGQRGDVDVDVVRRDGELIVSIRPYRRSIVLPDTMRDRRVLDATFGSGHLSMLLEP